MPTPRVLQKIKNITNPLIRERYLKYFGLPQDIRQIFFAVETADEINAATERNKLSDKQAWSASYVVGMVLLGETNIVNFVKSLKEECNLDNESARQLARDINSAIFLPVKESLKKIHKISEWPRENESDSQPTSRSEIPEVNERVVTLEEKKPEIGNNVVDLRKEE